MRVANVSFSNDNEEKGEKDEEQDEEEVGESRGKRTSC